MLTRRYSEYAARISIQCSTQTDGERDRWSECIATPINNDCIHGVLIVIIYYLFLCSTLEISDQQYSTFHAFLKYLYTDKVTVGPEDTLGMDIIWSFGKEQHFSFFSYSWVTPLNI